MRIRMILAAFLVAGAVPLTYPEPAEAQINTFVTRELGTLKEGGSTFRFLGWNTPTLLANTNNLDADLSERWPNEAETRNLLRAAKQSGATAVRAMAPTISMRAPGGSSPLVSTTDFFSNDECAAGPGCASVNASHYHLTDVNGSLQPVLTPAAWAAFDTAIRIANEEGVRLVIPLIDNFGYFNPYTGGPDQFAKHVDPSYNRKSFFTNPVVKQAFKNYIRAIVERYDRPVGDPLRRQHKSNPTILAWHFGNELIYEENLHCNGWPNANRPAIMNASWGWGGNTSCSQLLTDYRAWQDEMASFMKGELGVQQLLMDGRDDFHNDVLDNPDSLIDIVDLHAYEEFDTVTGNADTYYPGYINIRATAAQGKRPLVLGEFHGLQRVLTEDTINRIVSTPAISGGFLWALVGADRDGGIRVSETDHAGNAHLWPGVSAVGYQSPLYSEEKALMDFYRPKAFEVSGRTQTALDVPAAPILLPITADYAINWQSSAGAATYILERRALGSAAWTTIATGLVDRRSNVSDVAPLFSDKTAVINTTYEYRVSGVSKNGVIGPPSAAVTYRLQTGPYFLDQMLTLTNSNLDGALQSSTNLRIVNSAIWEHDRDYDRAVRVSGAGASAIWRYDGVKEVALDTTEIGNSVPPLAIAVAPSASGPWTPLTTYRFDLGSQNFAGARKRVAYVGYAPANNYNYIRVSWASGRSNTDEQHLLRFWAGR